MAITSMSLAADTAPEIIHRLSPAPHGSTVMSHAADSPSCKISMDLKHDDATETIAFLVAIGSDGVVQDGSFYQRTGEDWMIPAGRYDFCVVFGTHDGQKAVFRENVDVDGDYTFSADIAEATNHISFRPLLPDGSEPQVPHYDQRSETYTDHGNCARRTGTLFILDSNLNWFKMSTNMINMAKYTNMDGEVIDNTTALDAWTNDTDRFLFVNVAEVASYNYGMCFIPMIADGCKTQTVSNPVKDFKQLSNRFAKSEFRGEYDPEWADPSVTTTSAFELFVNGVYNSGLQSCSTGLTGCDDRIINIAPYSRKAGSTEIDIYPQPVHIEWFYPIDTYTPMGITAPIAIPGDGSGWIFSTERQNSNVVPDYMLEYLNLPITQGAPRELTGPFSYQASDNIVFGDNCPIVLFMRPDMAFDYSFIGRYGEVRTIDRLNHTLSVSLDGTEVLSDPAGINDFIWSAEASQPGPWDYEITDRNMKVGGLQGCNSFKAHFVRSDSYTFPALTALQMRDRNGTPADQFETGAGASVNLSCGSFEGIFTGDNHRYIGCSPLATVDLAYAPYGSDDFTALEATEIPEKYFFPGYGYYYTAALDAVDRKSPTGWFDLRISLADEAGNTQTQIVSPAFRIESQTGLENLGSEIPAGIRIEGRDIICPDDMKVYNAAGTECGKTSLAPGVYIVRGTASATKVIVR